MKCGLCCDNDCLDLPSLTEIKGNEYNECAHANIGHVILESIIELKYYISRHSKSRCRKGWLWKKFI